MSAEHKGFRVALLIKGPEPAGEYLGRECETAFIRPSPNRPAESVTGEIFK